MTEITLEVNKSFGSYNRGIYRFPIERMAVLSALGKFPGMTADQLSDRFDIELSIIKDVIDDLYEAEKIWIGLDGRLFLSGDYSRVNIIKTDCTPNTVENKSLPSKTENTSISPGGSV